MIILVDLFCGAGGTSFGATLSGATVVLAVDSWPLALEVHRHHHPNAVHLNKTLGSISASEFASEICAHTSAYMSRPGNHLHIHASPPCQLISSSNPKRQVNAGLTLVRWSLEVFKELEKKSERKHWFTYSLEQVSHPAVVLLLTEYDIPFRAICMADFGAPQTRKRIWAVSELAILDLMKPKYVDWRMLIPVPPVAKYISGTSLCQSRLDGGLRKGSKKEISTAKYFYTITMKQGNRYMDDSLQFVGLVSVADMIKLQTFPVTYFDIDCKMTIDFKLKLNANAVPPIFSKNFFDALSTFIQSRRLSMNSTIFPPLLDFSQPPKS